MRSVPYYLNGRPNQRALVLRWLEESYGSKEPVYLSSLTHSGESDAHRLQRQAQQQLVQREAGTARRQYRFLSQLSEWQGPDIAQAVTTLVKSWTELGGGTFHGLGSETSCFLLSRQKHHPLGNIWPAAIYPSGKFEVVFQHLRVRQPFDDPARREELRQRLNKIAGVDLPLAKIDLRPGFDLDVLLEPSAWDIPRLAPCLATPLPDGGRVDWRKGNRLRNGGRNRWHLP